MSIPPKQPEFVFIVPEEDREVLNRFTTRVQEWGIHMLAELGPHEFLYIELPDEEE